MGFEIFCATMIGLLLGAVICFGGYRFFLFLLPIWGFFFGFGLGAQSVQALLGDGFFGTVTSWAVGFVLALIFAVLSYLYYIVAVAVMGGSLGYGAVVALMGAIGFNFGFLTWIIGIVAAVAMAFITIRFNLAKYVIIVATALGGAALSIGTLVMGVNDASLLSQAAIWPNPSSGQDVQLDYALDKAAPGTEVVVYTMLGEQIRRIALPSTQGRLTLPVATLATGIYFASIERKGRVLATRKLVIAR